MKVYIVSHEQFRRQGSDSKRYRHGHSPGEKDFTHVELPTHIPLQNGQAVCELVPPALIRVDVLHDALVQVCVPLDLLGGVVRAW